MIQEIHVQTFSLAESWLKYKEGNVLGNRLWRVEILEDYLWELKLHSKLAVSSISGEDIVWDSS